MGKNARKRKSEGDMPDKKKPRRQTTSMDESDTSTVDKSPVGLFVGMEHSRARHVEKLARLSEPILHREKSDEYAEDEGRAESQNFLQMVKVQQERKKRHAKANASYIDNFTRKVLEDEKDLVGRIDMLKKDATIGDEAFLDAFTNAFAASRPQRPGPAATAAGENLSTNLVFASLFKISRQLTTNAHAILEEFEEANEQTTKMESGGWISSEAWADALDQLETLLDAGHAAGTAKYERLMRTSKHAAVADEDEDMVKTFYPSEEATVSFAGWGHIAKRAEKATKRLAKAVPMPIGR